MDIFIDYVDPNDATLAQQVVDAFITKITAKATAENLLLPYLYVNNAAGSQKPLRGYGDQSFSYIKSVADKYDPHGLMQKYQNNGFLVSNE